MLQKAVRLFLALLLFQFVQLALSAAETCPKRTEPDYRCRKACTSNENCKSKSKKRKKNCICDGVCGLSCIRESQKCQEDRQLVTKLKRGSVSLNGKPYKARRFKVGDVVSYKCRKGYTLSGPSSFTCSGIGNWKPWDKGRPSCRRVCKNPGKLKDGTIIGDSYEAGKTISFRCNPGYLLKGAPRSKCRGNLRWSSPLPSCEVMSCSQPKIPENSYIYKGKRTGYQYGDRVYIRCNSGYSRVGSPVFVCNLNGWTLIGASSSQCFPKSCGRPERPVNGYFEGTRFTYRQVVRYSCDSGYKLRGLQYRTCLNYQKWSGSTPLCEPVDCGDPYEIPNGSYTVYGTKFKDKYYVACKTGYYVNGSKEVQCQANGQWDQKPHCSEVVCDSRYLDFEHGKVIGDNAGIPCRNTYNCLLSFSCDNGYYLNNPENEKLVCEINGHWSKAKPSCLPKNCGDPRPLIGGYLQSYNFYYPSEITYRCYEKYEIEGPAKIKCQANGRWERLPKCIANCGDPGTPKNSMRFGENFKSGASVTFQCDQKYDLIGEKRITCLQKTATWSSRIPQCKANCGDPGTPEKGRRFGSSFRGGDYVNFQCNYGYDLRGAKSITCQQATADWSNNIPECIANCRDPGIPDKGSRTGYNFKSGGVVKFECDPGYDLIGAESISCQQATARWSNGIPKCNANCGDPGSPDKGRRFGAEFKSGGVVNFECDPGYVLVGKSSITCQQATATWSDKIPECKAKLCGNLGNIEGGRLVAITGYVYKATATYECNDKYEMDGDNKIRCKADGQWDMLPRCIANCGDPGSPDKGTRLDADFRSDGVVNFVCDPGYVLVGESSITCQQATATWSDKIPECREPVKKTTATPINVTTIDVEEKQTKRSTVMVTSKPATGVDRRVTRRPTTTVTYTHTTGVERRVTRRPTATVTGCMDKDKNCVTYKEWNYCKEKYVPWMQQHCQKICGFCNPAKSCGNLGNVEGGRLVAITGYVYKATATYECNDKYEMDGDNKIRCKADGQWDMLPRCIANCGDPGSPDKGRRFGAEFKSGGVVNFECDPGYVLVGKSSITCQQATATWSDKIPECKARLCGDPGNIEGGRLVAITGYVYQAIATYQCNDKYEMDGDKEIRCKANGQWDTLPRCIAEGDRGSSTARPVVVETGSSEEGCNDRIGTARCSQYRSYCKEDNGQYKRYMMTNCQKTCGFCKPDEA